MARGDSRLGTWQVLLTISMVITPLSVHGKSAGVPPCACVYVCACLWNKSAHVHESNHTCIDMIWKMTNTVVRACVIDGYYSVIFLLSALRVFKPIYSDLLSIDRLILKTVLCGH